MIPIGEAVFRRPSDGDLYIGSYADGYELIPTWEKKIMRTKEYSEIDKGIGAGTIQDTGQLLDCYDPEFQQDMIRYSKYYVPELRRGKKFEEINHDLKSKGLSAGTFSGQTFASLRNTTAQYKLIKYTERPPHILTDGRLVTNTGIDDLMPVKFAEFIGSDIIHERIGEFTMPFSGKGRYVTHQFTIERYGSGFTITPEFSYYDYGQLDIVGDHLRDEAGQLEYVKSKRVYEIMTGAAAGTDAAAGSWSLLNAGGNNVNSPLTDVDPLAYAMNTGGRGQSNFVLSNRTILSTYLRNTHINGQINPNNFNAPLITSVPQTNTILTGIKGLETFNYGVDSMITDANGFILGSNEAIIFGTGPSVSRSWQEQGTDNLYRMNKWFFGGYLYDATMITRITGVA